MLVNSKEGSGMSQWLQMGRSAATWKRPWAGKGEISAPLKGRGNSTGLACIAGASQLLYPELDIDKSSILKELGGRHPLVAPQYSSHSAILSSHTYKTGLVYLVIRMKLPLWPVWLS